MNTKTKATLSTRLIITSGILLQLQAAFAAPVPVETSTLDRTLRSDTSFGIGITVSVAQRPFIGVDDQNSSLPYIVFHYKDFYIEGLNAGYTLFDKQDINIDLLATPRFYEVQPSFAENGELDGIDKTRRTYLAGLSAQYRTAPAIYTLQLLTDIRESDGNEIVLSASKAFHPGGSVTLAPAIGITYQDAKLVDHFYGVQAHEVRVNRPQYAGKSSTNINVSLTTVWEVDKHIQFLGQIKYEQLGSGITNSPIVDEDNIVSAVVGAVYRF